jgi:hypothetical protein
MDVPTTTTRRLLVTIPYISTWDPVIRHSGSIWLYRRFRSSPKLLALLEIRCKIPEGYSRNLRTTFQGPPKDPFHQADTVSHKMVGLETKFAVFSFSSELRSEV